MVWLRIPTLVPSLGWESVMDDHKLAVRVIAIVLLIRVMMVKASRGLINRILIAILDKNNEFVTQFKKLKLKLKEMETRNDHKLKALSCSSLPDSLWSKILYNFKGTNGLREICEREKGEKKVKVVTRYSSRIFQLKIHQRAKETPKMTARARATMTTTSALRIAA